jgi:hypothetical protein
LLLFPRSGQFRFSDPESPNMPKSPRSVRTVRFTHVSAGFSDMVFSDQYFEPQPGLCKGTLERDGKYEKTVVLSHTLWKLYIISCARKRTDTFLTSCARKRTDTFLTSCARKRTDTFLTRVVTS